MHFRGDILFVTSRGVETILVTGTNGKTTTAGMLAHAMEKAGRPVICNRAGANLLSGVTAEFAAAADLCGRPRGKQYAVIECDEGALHQAAPLVQPRVIVVTNLFRDQLDRYGEVTHTLENIRVAIQGAPDALLCLNADCSLTASLALDLPNKVLWYGIEQGALPSRPAPEISDATHCIRCKTAYEYDYVSYGHLGGFRCPHCGYRRHPADVAVTEVVEQRMDGSSILLSLRGEKHLVNVNLPAVYNIYNAAGAVAAVTAMGLPAETAIQALGSFQCGFGRMEQFDLGQAGAKMMLVKNPAGCNQVIEFLQNVKEPFVLAVFLNDRGADGTDVSWIWDADFEGLQALGGRLTEVIVSGDRAGDMRVRMKYAGIPDGRIRVERDYARLVDWIAGQEKPVFLMPTYTAMLELRQAVIHKVGGQEFWEK